MKKINAFTLAEVLMTLVIIGVISAMTIPALKKVSEEHSYVAATKKAYNTLSDVTRKMKMEYGPVKMWYGFSMLSAMKKEMNVANKTVRPYNIYKLNGEVDTISGSTNSRKAFYTVDGMIWGPLGDYNNCEHNSDNYKDACRLFFVDINGETAPNIIGVDVHAFYLSGQGLFPFGAGEGVTPVTCNKNSTGYGCTARIISEGKISW